MRVFFTEYFYLFVLAFLYFQQTHQAWRGVSYKAASIAVVVGSGVSVYMWVKTLKQADKRVRADILEFSKVDKVR